jgi:poly-gamma-glutamate capsule biosynthesis protein CapA/YwtB (metallophosphatase superfamily)
VKLALAGDTMLGRGVARALASDRPAALFAPEVVVAAREADLFVLNLECCISERWAPCPDPRKPFFFRAPPAAAEALALLGVDCVTLANNHALDFGRDALLDTFEHLRAAGIAWVGAGADLEEARTPAVFERKGFRLGVIGLTDHPKEYAATPDRPGVAYGDLQGEIPDWLTAALESIEADAVLVSPHWGPNMVAEPLPQIRRAAAELVEAGATLVAGHSAHVLPRSRARSRLRPRRLRRRLRRRSGPAQRSRAPVRRNAGGTGTGPARGAPAQAGLLPYAPSSRRRRGLDPTSLPRRLRPPGLRRPRGG